MPSAITHAIVGISASFAISKGMAPQRFFALSILCAMLPDLDVLAFRFGIPYGNFWGHRGFFHSFSFSLLLGFCVAFVFFRKEGFISKSFLFYFLYFSVVTSTHGILDAFTNGGLGIALLSPFDNGRYFFWATPISVSPLSVKAFFGDRGIAILKNEIMWVWLPSIFVAVIGKINYSHSAYKNQGKR